MIVQGRQYLAGNASLGNIPLQLYNVGLVQQKRKIRLEGFPVLHLFVNRSGSGRFQAMPGGKEWSLADNQACILPARVPHLYEPHPGTIWMHGYVTIMGNGLNDLLKTMSLPVMETIPLAETEAIWPLFERIFQLLRDHPPDKDWRMSVLLYELLLEVLKQSPFRREPSAQAADSANAAELVAGMLREHYAEPILLADYEQSLGYTVQHMNRLFKQAYGVTMHQYLDDIRFEKSLQLLSLDMSIQDIASALGMEANYFIRIFKRVHGMTPGQYKAKLYASESVEANNRLP